LSGKVIFSKNDLAYHPNPHEFSVEHGESAKKKQKGFLCVLGHLGGKCLFTAGTIASPSSKVILRSKTPGD
jgi:hypothetical protein